MASQFQVQKPYVLTTLPRPLDPSTEAYVVGDVYGYAPAAQRRKRRRAELTVGVNGEAINIYDVSSARLVTSYPIPPESNLSCPASSFRVRADSGKNVSRFTYAATDESRINKITLFKDGVDSSGKADQTNRTVALGPGPPVVWLSPLRFSVAPSITAEDPPENELLVVKADGEILCLDGESLDRKWTSNATIMLQDVSENARSGFAIEFCRSVAVSELVKGIFKGNRDAFGLLAGSAHVLDDDTEALVLVSRSGSTERPSRHLHIIGRVPSTSNWASGQPGILQLHIMPLKIQHGPHDSPRSYRLDARNGSLLELHNQVITIHDLTASTPKIASTMPLGGTTSFLPLSKTSILCSTNTRLSVFNPVYRSLQEAVEIDLAADTAKAPATTSSQLVAYFPPLERAISIVDSNLVAIQLEAPKGRQVKRRAEGLLIDSIGRGIPMAKRSSVPSAKTSSKGSVFSNYLPGSMRGNYWERWQADQKEADSLFDSNNIPGFETLLAGKFGIEVEPVSSSDEVNATSAPKTSPNWQLPRARTGYPPTDRRWILYAIRRSFEWSAPHSHDPTSSRLLCSLPQSSVVTYLADAGHLTLSNLKAALRGKLSERDEEDASLAEKLITCLADLDPSLELMGVYLSATNLGAVEILTVLKTLMSSLELMNDAKKAPPKLLTNGTNGDDANEDEDAENEVIGMELDNLEEEIQKTVSYLNNEDNSVRGRGISLAMAKLGACPSSLSIKALRAIFKPEEILSLAYLLRIELIKGGWTDRYLDLDREDQDVPFDAPPDGIIKLIADLLGRCLDSLGPGGWLLNDATSAGDDAADFISSLTHEVSAALEGMEETVYLRNFLVDPLKYYESLNKQRITAVDTSKPIAVRLKEPGAAALPLSLKSTAPVSSYKVVSGGEVVQRSLRETGHLLSQKVGSYSLERIVI
ncbi:hypothetical protein F5Y18DRAFT_375355 [Xylariaceae sp. FL1019]|nr:hypothetical protein F5Y18DRAFT_375355 [Xylariaceae sp. FL1019]